MKKTLFYIILLITCISAYSQSDTSKIIVGIKHTPPFIIKSNKGYQGVSIDLWNTIAAQKRLNFEYKEYNFKDLLNAIAQNEVDVCINPFSVTSDRMELIDFTQPFYISNLAIAVSGKPQSNFIVFVKNLFSYEFLQTIFVLLIIIFVFGFLIWMAEFRKNPEFSNGIKGIGHGIWWSAVTMTTVGYGDKSPKTVIGRVIATIWMFTAVIIISGITGSIAASLTVNKIGISISKIEDLKSFRVGTVASSSSAKYLNIRNIKFKEFASLEEGMAAFAFGQIDVFVYDEPILKYYINNNDLNNKVYILPYKFNSDYYSFSFPKNSNLKYLIEKELIKQLESPYWHNILTRYSLGKE